MVLVIDHGRPSHFCHPRGNAIIKAITLLRKWNGRPILGPLPITEIASLLPHEAMKSERKQIQESNLLADKIEQLAVKLKKAMPAILAVTVVAVLGLLSYGLFTSVKEKESAKGWTALYFADTDTADLTAISTDYSSTTAGLWAKQTAADANMSSALEKVYLDRDLAETFYKEAIDQYQAVSEKSSDPFLSGRANFGLAQAFEGMGENEKALSTYRKVITNKTMGMELIAEVTKRVAWLESKSGEEFYTWYKSSRASAPVLNSKTPTTTPVPAEPNMVFPDQQLPTLVTPAPLEGTTPVEPTPDKPATTPSEPATTPVPEITTIDIPPTNPGLPASVDSPAAGLPKADDVPADKKP